MFFVIMFCSFLHLFLITSCFSFLLQVIEQRWRSVNSIYQRPHRLQEEAEGAVEGSDRRRRRTARRKRGPSPPTPREEEPEEEVAPVDESDNELVR